MSLIDECVIYDKSFNDDLLPFTIINNSSIKYNNGETYAVNIKKGILLGLMGPTDKLGAEGAWFPIFINNDANISTKVLSSDGSLLNSNPALTSGRIGIEDFLSFSAKFQSWTFGSDINMTTDWIINNDSCPFAIDSALMCWAKVLTTDSLTLSKFPIGSILDSVAGTVTDPSTRPMKKINDDHTFNPNQDNSKINLTKIVFNDSASIKGYSLDDTAVYKQATSETLENRQSNTSYTNNNNGVDGYMLWIADGDNFYYYKNAGESASGNISRSYVSPSLWSKYTKIYHALTMRDIKTMTGKTILQSRKIKKLAHALSTSPYLNDSDVSALQTVEISNLVTAYDGTLPSLKTVLIAISKILHNKYHLHNKLSNYGDSQTLRKNLILNESNLIHKLLMKYGSKATLPTSGSYTLSYNTALKHGDSINIIQSHTTLCDKSLTNSAKIRNNQEITLNKIQIKTELSDTQSLIKLYINKNETKLPLYDLAKVRLSPFKLNIFSKHTTDAKGVADDPITANGMVFKASNIIGDTGSLKETEIQQLVLQDTGATDPFLMQKYISCLWERVSGPTLKFDDQNKSSSAIGSSDSDAAISRFDTSSYIEPSIFVYSSGRYEIQCTFITPYGKFIKNKTIYVVDGRATTSTPGEANATYNKFYDNGQWRDLPLTNPNSTLPIIVNPDSLDVMISSFKNIAIHKHGIFWPIETDFQVHRIFASSLIGDVTIQPLKKRYKFPFSLPDSPLFSPGDTNSSLSFIFHTGNTKIKLDHIILQNLRNATSECKNCLSVCQPIADSETTIKYSSDPKPIASKKEVYLRAQKDPYSFTLRPYKYNAVTQRVEKDATDISFGFPPISTDFAPPILPYGGYDDNIKNQIGITIPNHTDNLIIHPPLLSSLPTITGYKLDYKADKDPQAYKSCFQKPINVTNSINFEKGLFHPASGWMVNNQVPSGLRNRSSVLKFRPGDRDTFTFIGPGLFSLKNTYDSSGVAPNVYKSAINLSISDFIRPDPLCKADGGGEGVDAGSGPPQQTAEDLQALNLTHKVYMDQYIPFYSPSGTNYRGSFHGYRSLEGGSYKSSEISAGASSVPIADEFGFSSEKVNKNNTESSVYNYRFAQLGSELRIKDLKIEDVEIKLNFLNYVNPKNIVVWLDVDYSAQEKARFKDGEGHPLNPLSANGVNDFIDQSFAPSVYGNVSGTYANYTNLVPSSGASGLNIYLSGLVEMNSTNALQDPIRLYLMNQEYIQNNEYNFNIKFSDHASKHNVLYDENSANTGMAINSSQSVIRSNDEIQPTQYVAGYSDKDSAVMKNIIRKNRLNISNNTFNKFKNRALFVNPAPLEQEKQLGPTYDSSTTFTLNVIILDEPDSMQIYDTTIDGEYVTGFKSSENKKVSVDIYNSLCSWELIVHTNKYKKYTSSMGTDLTSNNNTDIFGMIDYSCKSLSTRKGYNFISRGPDTSAYSKSFFDQNNNLSLIPRVNLNAPYVYINDLSLCQSAAIDQIGSNALRQPPLFPSDAILKIVAGIAGGAISGSLVGVLVSLEGFSAGYQELFDYFYALREARDRVGRDKEVYKPDYEHYPFGSPEKVLLNVSKDAASWYKLEATIFRYKNTPALTYNPYSFIRLNRGNIPFFSEFKFEIVESISQLTDNSMLEKSYTPTYNENNVIPSELSSSDIIDKLNDKYQSDLQINSSVSNNSSFFASIDLSNKNFIMIEGELAYNLFHRQDTIWHYKAVNRSTIPADTEDTAKIIDKALIFKNNKYYSVFKLNNLSSTAIADSNVICPKQDILLVFKKAITYGDLNPFDHWGLSKGGIVSQPPIQTEFQTTGLGSYGDGSPLVKKNILSYNLMHNKIYTINEIFNNNVNDRIKHTSITLKFSDDTVQTIDGQFTGYSYSMRDFVNNFEDRYHNIINNGDSSDIQLKELLFKLMNSTSNTTNDSASFMFLKSPNIASAVFPKDKDDKPLHYGTLFVDEDYTKQSMIGKLTDDQITTIKNRLVILQATKYNATVHDLIGSSVVDSNKTILLSDNIYYIKKHYDELGHDPTDCYDRAVGSTQDICPRKFCKKALDQLIMEKNTLLKTLELDNFAMSTEYIPFYQVAVDVTTTVGGVAGRSLVVKHNSVNDHLYWINIDPEQSCSIAEDMAPKILTSASYTCAPLTESAVPTQPSNNICPMFLTKGDGIPMDGDVMNFSATGPSPDSAYFPFTYTLPSGQLSIAKYNIQDKYPGIVEWKTYERNRSFIINPDPGIDGLTDNVEILVRVRELYQIGLPQRFSRTKTTTQLLADNTLKNDNSADINMQAGIGSCVQGRGSPAGSGLLNEFGSRIALTRVANIFNLDSTDNLHVQFRKIPRQLRGSDLSTTVYRYGAAGPYRQVNGGNPPAPSESDVSSGEGAVNNSFYIWHCLEKDKVTKQLIDSTVPDFLRLQNEMAYRSFYGSRDRIEIKDDRLNSQFSWEMIPYEYFRQRDFFHQ